MRRSGQPDLDGSRGLRYTELANRDVRCNIGVGTDSDVRLLASLRSPRAVTMDGVETALAWNYSVFAKMRADISAVGFM